MIRPGIDSRAGAIVPLTAICLVALLGMVALCIDLSLLALGKTQCQNAADMSAMAAARTLDGIVSTNNNIANAFTNGKNAAAASKVLGQPVPASQTTVRIGVLYYDTSTTPAAFRPGYLVNEGGSYTPPSGNNWGLAESRITAPVNFAFAKIFGITSMPVEAVAQAIHRPRDVAIVMDYSGSMAYDSYMARPRSGSSSNPPYSSLNNDTRVPRFGHYDANTPADSNSTYPPYAQAGLVNSELGGSLSGDYVRTDTQEILRIGNQTSQTAAGNPITEDFYTTTGTGSSVKAFVGGSAVTPVSAFDASGFPTAIPNWTGGLGDRPPFTNTTSDWNVWPTGSSFSYSPGTTYLKNAAEFSQPYLDSSTPNARVIACPTLPRPEIETPGSNNLYPSSVAGFTYGPGYWGKTFFTWPPVMDATANPVVSADATDTNAAILDWRQRFFWAVRSDGSGKKRLDDNLLLYESDGSTRRPTVTYTDPDGLGWKWQPNYEAILYWLKNTGPNPFPGNIRSGRLLYYDAIPDTVADSSSNMDQLFWKEYIDWVVGFQGWENTGTYGMRLLSGYGDDFSWATSSSPAQVSARPGDWHEIGRLYSSYSRGLSAGSSIRVKTASYSNTSANMLNWVPPVGSQIRFNSATSGTIYTIDSVTTTTNPWRITLNEKLTSSISSGQKIYMSATPASMNYTDNPYRPKHRFWFGPLTFVDFIWNDFDSSKWRSWRPGTCHEAPMWVLKTGIQAALVDIEKNHPNDWVSQIYFSVPKGSANDGDNSHRFNRPRGPLGKNYDYMKNALWYPPSVIQNDGSLLAQSGSGGEFRPYTSSFGIDQRYREAPYASGGTCPMWGFTLAYNQFSSNSSLLNFDSGQPVGMAGGQGRLGARKLVIFETDGVPNHTATAGFSNNGVGQSYFTCRMPSEYPSVSSRGNMDTTTIRETYRIVRTICDNASGDTSGSVQAYIDTSTTETIARATGRPGYATSNRPVLVHSLAFGGLFESTSSLAPQCLGFLQSVQTFGNTQTSSTTPLANYKVIIGTSDERIDKIKTAFTIMMQDGVQISLYK